MTSNILCRHRAQKPITEGHGLVWYALPHLFFNCTLCSSCCQGPEYSANHKKVSLVYFSMFEPIYLTPNSIMQKAGAPMLYDTASNRQLPCLYICPVANVLGRAFLIPCLPSLIAGTAADCTR